MCGIVGYLGNDALNNVIDGLTRLEYRGYDSVGVAYKSLNKVEIVKDAGRVINLKKKLNLHINSTLAIGHTRWATHGIANKINAHPHSSSDGRFIIVHNGIIDNYLSLKYEYLKGIDLISETDTEVIVNVIAYFAKDLSVEEAIKKTMSIIEGSYACLLIDTTNLTKIYFFKNKSPLLVGINRNNICFASDISGLTNCKKYFIVEDKEVGIADLNGIKLSDIIGIKKKIKYKEFDFKIEEIDKLNYDHFMLKEIYEQPLVIRDLINNYFARDELVFSNRLINKIKKADKINFVASGSSMYAAYFGKYYFEKICQIPCEVFCASELVYSSPLISKKPFFIFLSQSGETADGISVMKKFKNYPSLVITNNLESTMVRLGNFALDILAKKEVAVASTKAYMAMIVVCAMLARQVSGLNTNLKNNLKAVCIAIEEVLENKELFKGISEEIVASENVFYIGRGIDYWTSLEASLKLKEVAYISTEAYSSGELKHGPIALINDKSVVLAIITQEGTNLITRSNLMETKARGAKTIIIASKGLASPDDTVIIPNVAHYLAPLVSVVVVQLLAYYAGVLKHNDVDRPKNLAKSVTVE